MAMPALTIPPNPNPAPPSTPAPAPAPHKPPTSASSEAHPPAGACAPESPAHPPISPLTPTFSPSLATSSIPSFSLDRPLFTHSQPDQTTISPPRAEPIAFDDNPDVIALKSAISILQLQKARATRDMQTLRLAKEAALEEPGRFVEDLMGGRVGVEGEVLMGGRVREGSSSSPSSSSSSEDEEEEEVAGGKQGNREEREKAPWSKLPKPQTVVRCPPINWAQYGVVGESLDKLHAEQIAAPTLGAPVVLGPGGTYEFKAGDAQISSEPGRRIPGIAAPYAPGKDKIEKKAKGSRR